MSETNPEGHRKRDRRSPPPTEVDLAEILTAISTYKGFVFGTVAASIVCAVIVTFIVPPTFESRAVLQVGQVSQVRQVAGTGGIEQALRQNIEEPHVLAERLRQQYRVTQRVPPIPLPRVASVVALGQGASVPLVELRVHGRTPQESWDFLSRVTVDVQAEHQALLDGLVSVQRRERDRVAMAVEETRRNLTMITSRLEGRARPDDGQSLITLVERSHVLSEMGSLQGRLAVWDMLLSQANTHPTRIVVPATEPIAPVKPRRTLIIALAAAGAFVLSVVVAFVRVSRHPRG